MWKEASPGYPSLAEHSGGCPPPAHSRRLGSLEVREGAPDLHSRKNVVDADDTVGPGRAAVVHDGRIALHPDPAAVFRQEPVVLGGHLSLHQH